ncbi:CotY/CotZ family spore coat protein [Ornithinibacillus californiensis]|uniref:CotY/CotZ family spore coat protein n=1 Tax=Ornithinibacillus californiensis TaxID=161536 RepID=UPI00064DCB48|nr:CotY/CotZ family spore coat protein [Ornithinibacillus californiensis]
MSCCSHGKQSGECVCDVVRKIVRAQNEVAAAQDDCCTTGCENSIEQLLSPTTANGNGPTTIPFLLYCKGDCDLFFATAVARNGGTPAAAAANGNGVFDCVETPVFKAKKFKKGCCVELELLLFETANGSHTPLFNTPSTNGDCFIPANTTGNFVETGICITVDLHCYCAIQCLDPVTPVVAPISNGHC